MADVQFVRVTDVDGAEQIINLRQITRLRQEKPHWRVFFNGGTAPTLDEKEAKKLIARLPGLVEG